jgi:hypothetical protein
VVDGRTALSILLVVEIKGDRFGKLEFGEGGGVRNYQPVPSESHILHSELLGAGAHIASWHSVFSDAE